MSRSTDQTKPDTNKTVQEKKESKLWKFLLWSIPAYTYFFGYVSQSYYLEGLGFDEAEVSGDPGPTYRFAFNSFFYINSAVLKTAWPKYFEALNSNWWKAALIALGAGMVLYVLVKLSSYWQSRSNTKEKKNKEKNNERKHPFLFSMLTAVVSYILHILSVPMIIVGMTLITVIFIPAPLVGLAMAEKEIKDFKCEHPADSKEKLLPCTTLLLSDGTNITGNIKHKDSDFIYIYTGDGPESVPIDKIERRIRYAMKQ